MRSAREIKLAENLRKLLLEKKLSVTETARNVRMHKSTLHGYCHGVIPRNIIQLRDLAAYLGVDLSNLIFGTGDVAVTLTENNIEGRYEVSIRRVR